MLRHGQLFETFISFPNLLTAHKKARRGTRPSRETCAFFYFLESELFALQAELEELQYYPSSYRYFKISDPKERIISVAPFRDRVVHHALVNILEPIYEKIFIHDSYATRKNKGTHLAVLRAQQFLKSKSWYFKTDIDKYFDSVQQDILMKIIEKKIKDKKLLEITSRIIYNGGENGKGLPIGNLTSQFFANVYLHELDRFVKQELRVKAYVRYMDDCVLFSNDKRVLKEQKIAIEQFIDVHLGLKLKPKASFLNTSNHGLTFLGKRIFPAVIRFAAPNLRRMTKRMGHLNKCYANGSMSEDNFLRSMNSYWAMLSLYQHRGLRQSIIDYQSIHWR